MSFFKNLIKSLIDSGHTVDLACSESEYAVDPFFEDLNCKKIPLSCSRSVFNVGNIKAIKEIRDIVKNGNYDIVHCHTPIAAACTRIACRNFRKNGLRVIYTAHGFHFYKGAPLKNWLIFYPIEKLCARFTDTLITINKEDYALAKRKLKAKQIEYVPGVGVDTEKFANTVVDTARKREELGMPQDAFLLLSVGELNTNKNHQVVIRAMADLENKNVHYIIAGQGAERDNLLKLASELSLSDRVHLLGQRQDVAELYKTADLYVHPSFREGLPVALMEAMSAGLPCIASKIRGAVDLIDDNDGYLFNPSNYYSLKSIIELFNKNLTPQKKENDLKKISHFSINSIKKAIFNIYFTTC